MEIIVLCFKAFIRLNNIEIKLKFSKKNHYYFKTTE